MSSERLPEMTQAQREPLAFVELRLRFVGENDISLKPTNQSLYNRRKP